MERNPYFDLVITYQDTEYPLDLNLLTKREELLLSRKTGLDRQQFLKDWFRDDPEATLFGVWLALHRAMGDDAPAYDTVDVATYSDWLRLADPDGAVAWSAARAAAAEAETDPTPPPDPEPTG